MDEITVVGGGIAGLIAAAEAAEAGAPVRLLEARQHLGGRARSTDGDYAANLGPHALYTGTELWRWLQERGLHAPSHRPQFRTASSGVRFRWMDQVRRTPPKALLAAYRLSRRSAPVDRDLRSWAAEHVGYDGAQTLCGLAGPLVFHYDPGTLSAKSVMDKLRAILLRPVTPARYVEGGWSALVDRLAAHATSAGAVIELGHRVSSLDQLAARGPVILALDPGSARKLLRDEKLRPEIPRVALLDIGLSRIRHRDPYLVFDLDQSIFVTRTTAVVPSLATDGHQLVQSSVGLRSDEGLESGVRRLEALFDAAFPDWRERLHWHRRGLVTESTGAVDLPGTTWRDRTPVAYADGVWLAGDWVAAPGHLAEVSCNSAIHAAQAAVASLRGSTKLRPAS